jgi:inner membrane protein
MPTIFTHAAFAFAFSKLALDVKNDPLNKETTLSGTENTDTSSITANKLILFAASILGALPDADALFRHWVSSQHPFAHRGLTHSLFFASLIGFALALLFVKHKWNNGQSFWTLTAIFALATASHGFFDAMTTGGAGVAFFTPFDNTPYFFPFRPIPVAPFSAAALFTVRGVNLLFWEFALIWTFAIGAVVWHRLNRLRKIAAGICWLICLGMWLWKF